VSAIKNNFNIRKHLNIGNNPLCLMLGTYESRKGHEFVFKSFKLVLQAIPEAHLVVCGGGTEREVAKVDKIRKKIIPTEKIHLFGFIHNGASLINQVDVLLIGSQEFESFGLTAVEAMIRRKPVVSTNTGGLPEVIGTDNSCGYIVGQKDEIEFSEKIILLLRDEKLRKSMGNSGKKRAEELFSACNMSEEYLTAIKKK
jgi:glycosyltransferase involved in cell wall biosynthesis